VTTYDEDRMVVAASAIGTLATRSAPDEPRLQLEVILLGAVRHAIHRLGMPREEAYRTLAWLIGELESRIEAPPTLTLVP
jgi:hypothetical protein